jgi:hypothetical protein
MESSNQARERRKYPRISLDLPLEYRATRAPNVRGALVINASETGLLVHSIKEMPVGMKLKIVVMFPKIQLDNFEVLAKLFERYPMGGRLGGISIGTKIHQSPGGRPS